MWTIMHYLTLGTHVLAAGVWIGAMFFSLTVLYPRTLRFFDTRADAEDFLRFASHGARWKVLSAMGVVGGSGIILLALSGGVTGTRFDEWMIAKIITFAAAMALFADISWRQWPARIFATPDELPAVHRRAFVVALVMLTLLIACFAMGLAPRFF